MTKIGKMSEMLWAEKKHSLLIILQGMDGSGKDGVAKSVFMACPALVVDAHAFKKPSEEEFAHDFCGGFIKILLQRTNKTFYKKSL